MKKVLICIVSLVTVCSALDCTYNNTSISSTCDLVPLLLGANCSSCNEPLSNGICNSTLTTKRFVLCEGNMNITVCVKNCRKITTVNTQFAICSLNISTQHVAPTQLTCKYVTNQFTTTTTQTTTSTTTTAAATATTITNMTAGRTVTSNLPSETATGPNITISMNTNINNHSNEPTLNATTTGPNVTTSMNTNINNNSNDTTSNATNGAKQQKGLSKTAIAAISASAS